VWEIITENRRDIMDIAVLSDIHSNYLALEKCIDFALSKGFEEVSYDKY
jgi:hypothetical protein